MRWDRSGGSPDRGPVFAAVVKGSPAMRVLIASGEFDLSTPFASVEYSVSHLQLGTEARKRVEFVRYEGGHAAYMDPTARQQLFNDAQKLVMAH
jgi:carboxypeptidase C (cathepsin A)